MPTLPLIAHRNLTDILAWNGQHAITAAQFLIAVEVVAKQLPEGRHVLNLCSDRYHFSVTFAACIVSGRISLLPSTHTPEMVRQMQQLAPDLFCISDRADEKTDLPVYHYPKSLSVSGNNYTIPNIKADQVIAQVFTSGSTGLPVAHTKRWGSLVRNVQAEAERLGVGSRHAIVGTVPPQHMYGLESTVLMPLQTGAALHGGQPFYPADICSALAQLPRPRVLISTPFHLRTLLEAVESPPPADLLISATAPLSQALAKKIEAAFAAPLYEIYGCTETGQLASRQTASTSHWRVFDKIQLRQTGSTTWAENGHIEIATPLNDDIELLDTDPGCFLLHGRHADLVNIAGKRTSLTYLNHQLHAIPGVLDGAFLLPPEREDQATENVRRLTCLVVAPNLTPVQLLSLLRERIDPIFLPRPLLFVDALPRNATGKLPASAALGVVAELYACADKGVPA